MRRALVLAVLLVALVRALSGQALVTLQIKAVLVDGTGRATPVARHVLLISDNPQTVSTRRVFTTADGTAQLRLRPGNYTVESDQPVVLDGKAYTWTQRITIADGRDTVLELTAANAATEPIGPDTIETPGPNEASSALSLDKWRNNVVAVWTPTAPASGFIIDARDGLVVTNQQPVGTASAVEVQLSPDVKVAGSVLVADRDRDIALLRINPAVLVPVQPLPVDCTADGPPLASGQEIVTIAAPLLRDRRMAFGDVRRIEGRRITADLGLTTGSAGGPVFTVAGDVVGITAALDPAVERLGDEAWIVRIEEVCAIVADARSTLTAFAAPSDAVLPVEPIMSSSVETLQDAATRQAGRVEPYRLTTSAFDIQMLTPRVTRAARSNPDGDFLNWSTYVAEAPPVLLVRVTPKMSEGFWARVARGAASTQGIALPKIERFQSGFLRMQVRCGDTDVTPIHPFKLERRVSSTEAIYEGLYVFGPGALGPHCGTVSLALFAEKEPEKAETRVISSALIQRIWDDFAPYRAVTNP